MSIDIGSALPVSIDVRAEPARITESRSTHIIATVFAAAGNPVANAPVFFVALNTSNNVSTTEFMDISGPVFTDQNGEAENVMRTRRSSAGTARVRARTPKGDGTFLDATVDIAIVF